MFLCFLFFFWECNINQLGSAFIFLIIMYSEFAGKTVEIKDDLQQKLVQKWNKIMNLFQMYKTVLHIMLYSTLKIIKNVNYYKALKKPLWQIILLFPLQAGQISYTRLNV